MREKEDNNKFLQKNNGAAALQPSRFPSSSLKPPVEAHSSVSTEPAQL